MNRYGRQQIAATDYVRRHPGCTKMAAAKAIGPHGSTRYGYTAVNRAIDAGLIEATLYPQGYSLVVTMRGDGLVSPSHDALGQPMPGRA